MLPAVLPAAAALLLFASQGTTCADVPSCRKAAMDAAARQDFEEFHDLAWRAVQRGTPNDPELMYLLARAQSLSGRPGDALVMLRRLAEMGVATDAGEHEDFVRVRALRGWPDVERLMAEVTARPPDVVRPADAPAASAAPTAAAGRGGAAAPASAASAKVSRKAEAAPAPDAGTSGASVDPSLAAVPVATASAPAARTIAPPAELLSLTDATLDPVGLAYDATSRRFVVGDRRENKLLVADEVFKRVNDLIGAAAARFGTLSAVEIDGRRGELWVTSADEDGRASIHKLQLVSGRVLLTFDLPPDLTPARLEDILVLPSGAILLLDAVGSRLLALDAARLRVDRSVKLAVSSPVSLAQAGESTYVAHEGGVAIVSAASGRLTSLRTKDDVSLAGLRRIRAHGGHLIALQGDAGGMRLVRIRLSRDRSAVTAVEALDEPVASEGTALTISRDAAYYVARTDEGPTIRQVPLR